MTTAVRRHHRRRHRFLPQGWANPINRVLNLALYLVLCFMIGTGLVMWLRLPPGHGRRRETGHEALLGLTRHEWGDWHLYAGLAFLALSVLHLAMNRTWLMKIAARTRASRILIGLLVGAAIVAFFLLVPTG